MDSKKYTAFTDEVEKVYNKYFKKEDNIDFLLVVLEHNEDDTAGDMGVSGLGCPACITLVMAAMLTTGRIKHDSDGEKVH